MVYKWGFFFLQSDFFRFTQAIDHRHSAFSVSVADTNPNTGPGSDDFISNITIRPDAVSYHRHCSVYFQICWLQLVQHFKKSSNSGRTPLISVHASHDTAGLHISTTSVVCHPLTHKQDGVVMTTRTFVFQLHYTCLVTGNFFGGSIHGTQTRIILFNLISI